MAMIRNGASDFPICPERRCIFEASRGGLFLPSLRDLEPASLLPSVKTLGYFQMFLRNNSKSQARPVRQPLFVEQPKMIRMTHIKAKIARIRTAIPSKGAITIARLWL